MNRCALPDVVADIVRVALSHHLDVAAAGGPDGAANAVPGVTEATAMGPNGVSDAGHLWLLMRCGPADETHRAARTAHGQSPRRQDTCRPGDRPTRAGSSWPRVSPRSRPGAGPRTTSGGPAGASSGPGRDVPGVCTAAAKGLRLKQGQGWQGEFLIDQALRQRQIEPVDGRDE